MTIPKRAQRAPSGLAPRIKRPDLPPAARQAPIRHRTASRPDAPAEPTLSREVPDAVKRGYDIITENIRQGRAAASRFREGEYTLREVPDDLAGVSKLLIDLARELSTTTFDVVERAARELGDAISAARDRDDRVPAFRPAKSAPRAADAGRIRLTTRCEGHPKAVGRPSTIERPKGSVGLTDLSVDRLSLRSGGAPITEVRFEVDLSQEGLIAVVTIPRGRPPGVYSGLIYAKNDPAPLGTLTVEIFE